MKKKVVRKLMALALVSAMATSMLAGCGSSDDSGKDSGKDADKGSEETVLKVAAFEGGNGTQIWEDIAKAFEESHDGVKVELEMSPELDKDLTKAIQNGDVPYLRVLIDILHEWMEVRKMDSDGSTQIYRQMFIERERAESVFLPEI